MFGVFSNYELQVIHDWILGEASAGGTAFDEPEPAAGRRRPSYNALARRGEALLSPAGGQAAPDPDLQFFKDRLARADARERSRLLIEAMAPDRHWMPAGLYATQLFCAQQRTGRPA
jgi:hypothetical protein